MKITKYTRIISEGEVFAPIDEILELIDKNTFEAPFFKEDGSVGAHIVHKENLVQDIEAIRESANGYKRSTAWKS